MIKNTQNKLLLFFYYYFWLINNTFVLEPPWEPWGGEKIIQLQVLLSSKQCQLNTFQRSVFAVFATALIYEQTGTSSSFSSPFVGCIFPPDLDSAAPWELLSGGETTAKDGDENVIKKVKYSHTLWFYFGLKPRVPGFSRIIKTHQAAHFPWSSHQRLTSEAGIAVDFAELCPRQRLWPIKAVVLSNRTLAERRKM